MSVFSPMLVRRYDEQKEITPRLGMEIWCGCYDDCISSAVVVARSDAQQIWIESELKEIGWMYDNEFNRAICSNCLQKMYEEKEVLR